MSSSEAIKKSTRLNSLQHTVSELTYHEYHRVLENMAVAFAETVTDEQWEDALAYGVRKVF